MSQQQNAHSINPFYGETIQRHDHHDAAAVSRRLDMAVAAQAQWQWESFAARAERLCAAAALLDQRREKLARLASVEMGKLIGEATGEVEKCAWVCRYYASEAERQLADRPLADDDDRKSFTAFEPLGVLLAVMPWNFPYWQVFRATVPALMAGNAVVLKHASNVTGCALAIEQLFRDAGLAEGLFSTVVISGRRASELMGDERIVAGTLTGSEGAGSAFASAAAAALKPTVLELGGSDAFVVLDLDAPNVVSSAVTSRFMNCGQSCIAAKRFIVLDRAYDEFVARMESRIEALVAGDPLEEDTTLAPMASVDLRDDLHAQVTRALADGARLVTGGTIPDGRGAFYAPTLLTDLPRESEVYREELFGPVATVFRARDLDEAVAIANDSPYGLGGSVWSSDAAQAIGVARRVESGAVYVNRIMASDPRLPFGGIKRSGYGRELAGEGIRAFVNDKTISMAIG